MFFNVNDILWQNNIYSLDQGSFFFSQEMSTLDNIKAREVFVCNLCVTMTHVKALEEILRHEARRTQMHTKLYNTCDAWSDI